MSRGSTKYFGNLFTQLKGGGRTVGAASESITQFCNLLTQLKGGEQCGYTSEDNCQIRAAYPGSNLSRAAA